MATYRRLAVTEPFTAYWLSPPPALTLANLPGIAGMSMATEAVYLHGRRAAGGAPQRLVFVTPYSMPRVQLPSDRTNPRHFLTFYVGVVQLPGFWGSAADLREVGSKTFRFERLNDAPFGKLQYYAGQSDPADRSHFTIEYAINGERGTIDGWLRMDDTVDLVVRDGPAVADRSGDR
ncbi:MAG TPA: hypothetical protein VGR35_10115 [Tepidisphaeraceae bacterium]|nr:hypothetical protein [Tepidisphaeraceae bacterium]